MIESALYIVATPIGNLDDISKRALDVLNSVDKIAAEDTRHSKKLLSHYNIKTPLTPVHEHNEKSVAKKLIDFIKQNKSLALISDSGTPLISDPGYNLVSFAKEQEVKVIPIPGPCALVSALSASGFSANKFIFMGFLPVKSNARVKILEDLKTQEMTTVFYEAPHRIISTLQLMRNVFGEGKQIAIAREMTKKYETIIKHNIGDILDILENDRMQSKGEIVIVLSGVSKDVTRAKMQELPKEAANLLKELLVELPVKKASYIIAKVTKINKNIIYQHAVMIKNENKEE